MDIDAAGDLFIADNENDRIRKINASTGVITTVADNGTPGFSGDGGAATGASLHEPHDIVVDSSGNLFFSDAANDRIRRVDDSTGVITTFAGTGTAGFSGDGAAASAAPIDTPTFLALDASGNLFVADAGNKRVRKISASTGNISTVAGNGSGGFSGDGGPATAASMDPSGIAVDGSGNLFVAGNDRVRKVDASTGIITTVAGNGTAGLSGDGGAATAASLNSAQPDMVVDSSDNLFISDSLNHRVRKVDGTTGIITTVAGSGPTGIVDSSFSGDGGPATSATLAIPFGLALDSSGNLYVAAFHDHVVRKVEGVVAIPPAAVAVPGLTTWALFALAVVLGLMVLLTWRRKLRTG